MSPVSPNPPTMTILTNRFPGVLLWFGESTRSWWAMVWVSWGWRLVEATDVEELTRAIVQAGRDPQGGKRGTGGDTNDNPSDGKRGK